MIEVYKMEKALLSEGSVEEMMTLILRQKGVTGYLDFGYNTYGKPFLYDYPEYHFNGSHSGDYVVCALASDAVGIDIQEIREDKDVLPIARRFMSATEVSALCRLPMESRSAAFYRLWAQNEAYMKYTGLGMAMSMKDFSVCECRGVYCVMEQDTPVEGVTMLPVRIQPGYEAWVCGEFDDRKAAVIALAP
jgi:4'-phosphopantetheinyl transferase